MDKEECLCPMQKLYLGVIRMTEKLLAQLKKDLGDEKAYAASEVPNVEVISTGSIGLDFATGIGGFARGSLNEVFGPEGIGKTTLSYYMIAEAQKKGLYAAFLNLEGRFSAQWAKKVANVNLDNLLVAAPDPGSEAVETAAKIVNSGGVGVLVFDSIGAMVGDKESIPGEKKQVGGQSALVTQMVSMLLIPAARNGTTVIFLNQVRDVFGAAVPMVESPGGHALKHSASIRVQLKPTRDKILEVVNGEKKEVGYRVAAFIKKNKLAAPKQVANWQFVTDEVPGLPLGIDRVGEVIDLALRLNVVERGGAMYRHETFPDGSIKGKDAVIEFIRENENVYEQIRQEVMALAGKQKEGIETLA
jgi:recombination protein RecA